MPPLVQGPGPLQSSTPSTRSPTPIPLPARYGRYCSVTFQNGTWAVVTDPAPTSNPCQVALAKGTGGSIRRAGYWGTELYNQGLVRCPGQLILGKRGMAAAPVAELMQAAAGKTDCQFVLSPTGIPVFDVPYGPLPGKSINDGVSLVNGYDFVKSGGMDIRPYGCTSSCSVAKMNRLGKRGIGVDNHDAFDWVMAAGREVRAAADGIVIDRREREVSYYCTPKGRQAEIYIEHAIGPQDDYQERFVSYYAHMRAMNVKAGDRVTRGQKIGEIGDTGCSDGPHLHFAVTRITNGSLYRFLSFQVTAEGNGDNGYGGRIDPFGWKPAEPDPAAMRWVNSNIGAFSLNLFRDGQLPPLEQ